MCSISYLLWLLKKKDDKTTFLPISLPLQKTHVTFPFPSSQRIKHLKMRLQSFQTTDMIISSQDCLPQDTPQANFPYCEHSLERPVSTVLRSTTNLIRQDAAYPLVPPAPEGSYPLLPCNVPLSLEASADSAPPVSTLNFLQPVLFLICPPRKHLHLLYISVQYIP